jgi:hypothetical protein
LRRRTTRWTPPSGLPAAAGSTLSGDAAGLFALAGFEVDSSFEVASSFEVDSGWLRLQPSR